MQKSFQKITLAALFVLATCSLSAQSFGVRAGGVSSTVKFEAAGADLDIKGATNLALGLFVELPIGDVLSIQPELNYMGRGFTQELPGDDVKTRFAYVDLGALVKLRFGSDSPVGFYVGAGPYYSYLLSGKIGDDELDFDNNGRDTNRGDFSVAGAAGVTFGGDLRFFGEARYIYGLNNLSDLDGVTINNRTVMITGGVMVPFGG
ncbi:MAG: porin family protein [Saprospiraceae bacterium]